MILFINNNLKAEKVYIHLMNKKRKTIKIMEVVSNEIEIDLNKYQFCYFKDDKNNKTEKIILSNNLSEIRLDYNRITKRNDANVYVHNESAYGTIHNITLRDEKNLFFRDNKEKNLNILLPKNYDSNKKYGVIIMFDSQNIFDINKIGKYTKYNDPYGGWQVEASLASLKKITNQEYIVVGIENCDKYREIELTPSTKMGKFKDILLTLNEDNLLKGELDYFGDFINETVFPYVESHYNVDLNEVGIVGSSCGGLASFYLGLRDFNRYKFIFTFTPATGFIEDETLEKFYKKINLKKNQNELPYLFYYQGKKGKLEKLLYDINLNFLPLLIKNGYPKELIDEYLEVSAEHNETMWRYGFNYAIYKYIEFKGKRYGSK